MSLNSINGINKSGFNFNVGDPIKPETRTKLKELGLDGDTSIRTETQAQAKIQQKTEEIQQQIKEKLQAEAATQNANNSQNIQPQNIGNIQKVDGIDGVNPTQQVQQPKEIEAQNNVQNKQTGNEQLKAFASSNSIQQPQQNQPFQVDNDLKAMYNKLKLGLI